MHTLIGEDERAQFEAALRARNLVPPKDVVADGTFHRCNTHGRNGKGDGSYVIYGDGTVPAGGFQNFQDGLGWQSWRYLPRGRDRTAAEDAEAEKKTEAARKRRDAAVLDGQKRAAGKARRLWDAATPVTAHPYLTRKQIQTNGVRTLYGGSVLVIPAKNADGTLRSLQFIDKDGRKRFLKGGAKKGCYYAILGHGSTIYVAEGFATAASINEVTGCTTFVAFDAGNLQPVAKMVREKHPSAEVVICADDDWKTSGNPGLALARRAARVASAKVARPDFGQNRRDRDTDFNDLFAFIGADAVKRSIEAAMTPDELLVQVLKAEPTLVHDDKTAAELAELKQKNRKLFEDVRNAVRGKVRSKVFDEVVGEAQKKESEVKKVKPSVDPAALEKAAGDLVACEDVLRRFGASIEADGLVQETENAKLLYLTLTSRLFEHPVSAVVKGVSSGGKSFTLERVLAYFPESAFFSRTQWSEHGPVFSDEEFKHRTIVIYEAFSLEGKDNQLLAYFIRTLLSERRISYETVEKSPEGGMRSRLIEKEGPTGLITTTTSASLHPENETRMLSLSIKDSPEQTKAVLAKTAQRQAAALRDLSAWVAFQGWLATGERRVAIPYAEQLAEKIRPVAVRLRRDFRAVLSLIEACALLHRNSRERDGQGRIVATLEDYAVVHGLVSPLITEAAGEAVSETVRDTVKAVAALVASGRECVSHQELATALKVDVRTSQYRVRRAIDGGFLQNLEAKYRRKAKIVLGEQLPQENSVLPRADELFPREGVPDCVS